MDCDSTQISCQLAELVSALSRPSDVELWGLFLSGAAALGTISIAAMNLRLMSRQRRLESDIARRALLSERARFADAIEDEIGVIINVRAEMGDVRSQERNAAALDLVRVARRTGEESAVKLFDWAIGTIKGASHSDADELLAQGKTLVAGIDSWVRSPDSLRIPETGGWYLIEVDKSFWGRLTRLWSRGLKLLRIDRSESFPET